MTMVRKQIYIEPNQEDLIKQAAKRRSVSEAEIIRLAIERQLGHGNLQSLPPDPTAWEQALQVMMALRAQGAVDGQTRTWQRQDLYEERASRYGRNPD